MGLFGKKPNYTESTIGIIKGFSTAVVKSVRLPLAEYEVNGVRYRVRVPYDVAVINVERINENYGSKKVWKTKAQGDEVKIVYDPDNPKKAKVVE